MKRPLMNLFAAFAVLSLALSSLACSFTVNVPTVKTGDLRTVEISEDYPEVRPAELTIKMGGGKLDLRGGSAQLVDGSIEYNVDNWDPSVERDGRAVVISQKVTGSIPFGDQIENNWNLMLGSQPMDLTIEAGAYEGTLDLSGVPLTRLKITDGASQSNLVIDTPNPVQMESFSYETGASNVKITGIANSDTDEFNFSGGAGNFTLDFSGTLKRDMRADLEGGLGNITIIIPRGMNARIDLSSSLNTISTEGAWTVENDVYSTNGEGPLLRIRVQVGVGNLNLVNE